MCGPWPRGRRANAEAQRAELSAPRHGCAPRHGLVCGLRAAPRCSPDGPFSPCGGRQANAEAQSEELQRQQLAGQKKEVAATASQENSAYKQLVRRLMIEREREREGGGGEGRSCIFTYTRGIPL